MDVACAAVAHREVDPARDLIAPSLEARTPLAAVRFDGPAGKLPASAAGVSVSRPGVVVTAFGNNPDGSGTLLRLWEHAGTGGPCTVTLPAGIRAQMLRRSDLRGRILSAEAIPIRDGKFEVNLGPYAQASFLIG